jgi:hypothetical protein
MTPSFNQMPPKKIRSTATILMTILMTIAISGGGLL